MATVYYAKWILLPDGEVLINGGITVEGDRIREVGPRGKIRRNSGDRAVNCGEMLLLPGFINIHTHLEESVLRGMVKGDDESFSSWIIRRRNAMLSAPPETILSSARLAIREALANGITTIVDTSSTDIPAIVLRDEPVRSWVIHEVHNDNFRYSADFIGHINKRIERLHRYGNTGVGPYGIFSLSPVQHKSLAEFARSREYLWSCHIAESSEELQAFSAQNGELYTLITRDQPWPYGSTERGSMYFALTNNLIPQNGICCHCNYMSSQELSLLKNKNSTVMFSPLYNAFLGQKAFPIDVAVNRDVNVCIGTESPSSNEPVNLFDDLFTVKITYPHISAFQLIRMVTSNAAKALRCNEIGVLEAGRKADMIGLRFAHDPHEDILEEAINAEPNVGLVIVNGEEVIVGI